MSDKNRDDFWKELMGEEQDPPKDEASEETDPAADLGFKVEYLSRDGEKISESNSNEEDPPEDMKIYHPHSENLGNDIQSGSPAAEFEDIPVNAGGDGDKKNAADDFELDFDFDKEYEDVEEKPVRRGRTKRTGCLGE